MELCERKNTETILVLPQARIEPVLLSLFLWCFSLFLQAAALTCLYTRTADLVTPNSSPYRRPTRRNPYAIQTPQSGLQLTRENFPK
jgi:hypothetical protein